MTCTMLCKSSLDLLLVSDTALLYYYSHAQPCLFYATGICIILSFMDTSNVYNNY